MTLDAATRQRVRRERDRIARCDLGLPGGRPRQGQHERGNLDRGLRPAGRPALNDTYEAWVAEIEKALAAHEQTLVNA